MLHPRGQIQVDETSTNTINTNRTINENINSDTTITKFRDDKSKHQMARPTANRGPLWLRKVPIGKNGTLINPIRDYLTKQLSAETRRCYISVLRSFVLDWLGQRDAFQNPAKLIGILAGIQVSDAAEYRDTMLQKYSPATIAKRMSVLSGIYEELKNAGLLPVPRNPWKIPRPKVRSQATAGLTKGEAERILAQPDISTRQGFRDYVMLLILFSTGIRKNELRNITTQDIQRHSSGNFVLNLKVKGDSTKVSSVKLRSDIYSTVKAYIDKYRIDGYIFTSLGTNPDHRTGKPLSGYRIWLIMKKYLKQAGLNPDLYNVHSTRVTALTLAHMGGAKLAQIQALAHHSDPKTTVRYLRLDLNDSAADYIDINFTRDGLID